MLNTSLILAAAEGHHVVNELPMDPIWYGVLVFALLMAAPVSYTHLRAHETGRNLVCRLLLEKKNTSPSPRDRG